MRVAIAIVLVVLVLILAVVANRKILYWYFGSAGLFFLGALL
jgi:hypothetical protein